MKKIIFMDGADIRTELVLNGNSGDKYQQPRLNPITGTPEFFTPPQFSGRQLWAEEELWIFDGQSNVAGQLEASDRVQDWFGIDSPDNCIYEISDGENEFDYRAAPAGEPMVYRYVAQDGRGGRTSKLAFAKARRKRFPGIKKIYILARAQGSTGFSTGNWDPSGVYPPTHPVVSLRGTQNNHGKVLADANAFLANHPTVVVAGIVSDLGPTDGRNGVSGVDFTTLYTQRIASYRASIPRASNACVIIQKMPQQVLALNAPGVSTFDEVDAAMVAMGTPGSPSYLGKSAVVETQDLPVGPDNTHFTQETYLIISRRIHEAALEAADFSAVPDLPKYHMVYDRGEGAVVDLNGSGARVYDGTYTPDWEVGPCLHHFETSPGGLKRGYDTDMVFAPSSPYTKFLFFKRYSPNSYTSSENFISGRIVNPRIEQRSGHMFSRQAAFHRPHLDPLHTSPPAGEQVSTFTRIPPIISPLNGSSTQPESVPDLHRWMSFALTFDGSAFRFYFDGKIVAGAGAATSFAYPAAPVGRVYDRDPDFLVGGEAVQRPVDMDGLYTTQIGAWGDLLNAANLHGVTHSVRLYNGYAAPDSVIEQWAAELS